MLLLTLGKIGSTEVPRCNFIAARPQLNYARPQLYYRTYLRVDSGLLLPVRQNRNTLAAKPLYKD
jgi:hypothetical protein